MTKFVTSGVFRVSLAAFALVCLAYLAVCIVDSEFGVFATWSEGWSNLCCFVVGLVIGVPIGLLGKQIRSIKEQKAKVIRLYQSDCRTASIRRVQ